MIDTYFVENGYIYHRFTKPSRSIVTIPVSREKVIHAEYSEGTLYIELREPTIPSTQWQGALISENCTVRIFINDLDSGELELINGIGDIPIEFEEAGTYKIRVESSGFQFAEIEVIL